MSDGISGFPRIQPTYPVKPVQPVPKDRETGSRKRQQQEHPDTDDDREQKHTIDEHV